MKRQHNYFNKFFCDEKCYPIDEFTSGGNNFFINVKYVASTARNPSFSKRRQGEERENSS